MKTKIFLISNLNFETQTNLRKNFQQEHFALSGSNTTGIFQNIDSFQRVKLCLATVDICLVHFIFHFSFFVSFGDEVTKVRCHFQAKTVQLIFFCFSSKCERWNEPGNINECGRKFVSENETCDNWKTSAFSMESSMSTDKANFDVTS